VLIDEMEIYYYVVEYHSFTKAAQRLGVSNAFISKKISKLEKYLGVNLLTRSTRKITVTEAGRAFHHYCSRVVAAAQQGYDLMADIQGKVTGQLTISAPPAFADYCLAPVIKAFSADHPEVKLQLHLGTHLDDVIAGGFDLVLRSATLESSNLIARKLTDLPMQISASPGYWKQHGLPQKPQQLMDHCWAIYSHGHDTTTLELTKGTQTYPVTVHSHIQCTTLNTIKALMLNGTCIAVLPLFMQQQQLDAGELIAALTPYTLPSAPMYLLTPKREHTPPKVTVFIDYLRQYGCGS